MSSPVTNDLSIGQPDLTTAPPPLDRVRELQQIYRGFGTTRSAGTGPASDDGHAAQGPAGNDGDDVIDAAFTVS